MEKWNSSNVNHIESAADYHFVKCLPKETNIFNVSKVHQFGDNLADRQSSDTTNTSKQPVEKSHSQYSHLVADSLLGTTLAIPALNSNDLEVHRAQFQTRIGPCLEVILDGDRTTGTVRFADGDVLVESGSAFNGWLVDTLVLPDSVGSTVTVDRALLCPGLRHAYKLVDDVVLHKRIGCPAIDGETCKSRADREATIVGDGAGNGKSDQRLMLRRKI